MEIRLHRVLDGGGGWQEKGGKEGIFGERVRGAAEGSNGIPHETESRWDCGRWGRLGQWAVWHHVVDDRRLPGYGDSFMPPAIPSFVVTTRHSILDLQLLPCNIVFN